MRGNKQILSALNQVLTTELTSINQFFLHARMYKNWGFESLNEKVYKKSIKDMKQADSLIERILFLQGLPNLQALGTLNIGEHTEEMLNADMDFVVAEVDQLKQVISLCEQERDYVSREILQEILEDEEEYIDWLEAQQYQIDKMGIKNYLQSQLESE